MLQFGSASGSGYLSREEVDAGTEELKKFGTFKDGIFRRNDDVEGRRNLDGYQAIWEHVHGRADGVSQAALSRSDHGRPRRTTSGCPMAGMPGVSEKPLGTFTERQCAAALIKLARGATYRAGGRSVYLVVAGSGIMHDQPYRPIHGAAPR